jgi:hypothetical protein
MLKWLSVIIFSLAMTASGAVISSAGLAAADKSTATEDEVDKEAPRKDIKFNLVVQVSGGDPAKPLRNAEVSVMGADGTELKEGRSALPRSSERGNYHHSNCQGLEDLQGIAGFQQISGGAPSQVAATGLTQEPSALALRRDFSQLLRQRRDAEDGKAMDKKRV